MLSHCSFMPGLQPKGWAGSFVDDEHYGRSPTLLRLHTGRLRNSLQANQAASLCGAKRRSGLKNLRYSCLEWLDLHYNISVTVELIKTSVCGFLRGVMLMPIASKQTCFSGPPQQRKKGFTSESLFGFKGKGCSSRPEDDGGAVGDMFIMQAGWSQCSDITREE